MFVISSATEMDGKLSCNFVMKTDKYEEAIKIAQNKIAEDFGYKSWGEYLGEMDPEIKEVSGLTEHSRLYKIRDEDNGHKECYLIEWI